MTTLSIRGVQVYFDSFFILPALQLAAANIWQTVAAPLLEQNQKELKIMEIEIADLEKKLGEKRMSQHAENAFKNAESQTSAEDSTEDQSTEEDSV